MALKSINNWKRFLSDYYLGTVFAKSIRKDQRLGLKTVDEAKRFFRAGYLYERLEVEDLTPAQLLTKFGRSFLGEILDFHVGTPEDGLYPLYTTAQAEQDRQKPLLLLDVLSQESRLDAPEGRRIGPMEKLAAKLLEKDIKYGYILNGSKLRLIHKKGEKQGSYLEFDFANCLETNDKDSFKIALQLFHSGNFVRPQADTPCRFEDLEVESLKYAETVSTRLKTAVFQSAETLIRSFIEDYKYRNDLPPDYIFPQDELNNFHEAALNCLYRLLFILYAEAKDEKLHENTIYKDSYSLETLTHELINNHNDALWPANEYGLWHRLLALFRIYDKGLPAHGSCRNIPPRGSDFFSSETPSGKVLESALLDDRTVARILLSLMTTEPRRGVGRERVAFGELKIEHLGSIYEGLLEYEPKQATSELIELEIAGKEYALPADEVLRICKNKSLDLKGDSAIVAGTTAQELHPAFTEEDDETPEDDEAREDSEDVDEEDKGIKKNSKAQLIRRLAIGEFYFIPGSARKGSGSFYTRDEMVDDLVKHSLDPFVQGKEPEQIEALKIIDPACGSAHFLVGAMRFLGKELYKAYNRKTHGKSPPNFKSPSREDDWIKEGESWCKRRIAERCLYGIDLNPTAVQLARVALWIESLAGDRPLSYFQHHVRCGNSLLGTWTHNFTKPPMPKMPSGGLTTNNIIAHTKKAAQERVAIDHLSDFSNDLSETVKEIELKEAELKNAEHEVDGVRLLFNLRSASIFIPEIWGDLLIMAHLADNPTSLLEKCKSKPWWPEFQKLIQKEKFFHWELEFPEIFLKENPGFDVVLGNPPWDKIKPDKKEFYGHYDVLIRAYVGGEMDTRIKELHAANGSLASEFQDYEKHVKSISSALKAGGDFNYMDWDIGGKSTGGDADLFKFFTERAYQIVKNGGRVGFLVPSSIYNNEGCTGLRHLLMEKSRVKRFFAFENRNKIFQIHSSYKFVNIVFEKSEEGLPDFVACFMRHNLEELIKGPPDDALVPIVKTELEQLSPGSFAFLEYRSKRDREIILKMYKDKILLGAQGPDTWNAKFYTQFHMSNDRDLWTNPHTSKLYTIKEILGKEPVDFDEARTQMAVKGFWPLYEGKDIEQYLVNIKPIERWVNLESCQRKNGSLPDPNPKCVFRDIASNTNERTCLSAVLPEKSCFGHTISGFYLDIPQDMAVTVMNSFVFDFLLRLRTAGMHLSFTYMSKMPLPNGVSMICKTFSGAGGKITHISESKDLWQNIWLSNQAVAKAYGINAEEFEYILSAFPGFARKRPEFYSYLLERIAEWKKLG